MSAVFENPLTMTEYENPLTCDPDPEETALKIRGLLSLVEFVLAEEMASTEDNAKRADRMYGAELAVQLAVEAINWLGLHEHRKSIAEQPKRLGEAS